jgi:hypothetical protein
MKFLGIIILAFILFGCSFTEVQRYKDIHNPSQSKVAVVFRYDEFPEYKVAKENFEKVLATKGFEVVQFEPLDSTLDYLVVSITGSDYRDESIRVTLVDYKKREIVSRFTYAPFSKLSAKKIRDLFWEMFDVPIDYHSVEANLKNDISKDYDVRNLVEEREYASRRLDVLRNDSVGKPLVESFEMYRRIVKTKDSSLADSMEKNRDEFFAGWKGVSDSICGAVNSDDSLVADIRSIYETVLKNDIWRNNEYRPMYFVLYNWISYRVAPDSSLESLKNADVLKTDLYEWKKMQTACPSAASLGQEVLVLTEEYRDLLNTFMGVKERDEGLRLIDVYTVPGFEEAMSRINFFEPAISVEIQHDAYAFDYSSYPIILKVVYNNVFNIAVVYVWEGSAMFSIRLVKNDGTWQIVEKKRELIL